MLGRAGPVELLSTLPLDDQPPERSGLIIGTQPKFLPTGAAHPGLTSEAGAAAPPPAGFLSMHTFLDPNGSSLLLVHRPGPLVLVLPLAKSWRPTGRAGRPPGPVHPPHRCVGVFGRCLCDEGAAENEVRASTGRVSIEHPPPPPIQSPSSPGPRRTPPKEARRKGHRTWGGGRWGAGAGPCRTVVPEFPKESINIKTAVWDSLGIFGCWICSPGFPKLTTSGRPSSSEPHTELNRLGANAFGPCAPAQKN